MDTVDLLAAHSALSQTLVLHEPMDRALATFFRNQSKQSSRQRRQLADIVYGIWRGIDGLLAENETPQPALSWVLLYRYFAKRQQSEVMAECRRLAAADKQVLSLNSDQHLTAQALLPNWVIERLPLNSASEIIAAGQGLSQRAPLDIRINRSKVRLSEVQKIFQAEGLSPQPMPYSRLGLRFDEAVSLQQHPLYQQGAIEIQDEGSQLIAALCPVRRGQTVVDFCAGAGGKTLALADMMANKGVIYALDTVGARLQKLQERTHRAGVDCVRSLRINDESDFKLNKLHGKCDVVLVDAPCSGLGTLRRSPDLKYRQNPATIAAYVKKQAAILAAAAPLVAVGGYLIYATCSILEDENEAQVMAFLQRMPMFELKPIEVATAFAKKPENHGTMLRLWPHQHKTDGFFAAVLQRMTSVKVA